MPPDTAQHLAMLQILYGASASALDAFRAADNPVDEQLVIDLETMVTRTRAEIERLSAHLARPSRSPALAGELHDAAQPSAPRASDGPRDSSA